MIEVVIEHFVMTCELLKIIAISLPLVVCGCSRANIELEPGVMNDVKHSHYHVHAVDASHEHGHSTFGGHTHPHQHPNNEADL